MSIVLITAISVSARCAMLACASGVWRDGLANTLVGKQYRDAVYDDALAACLLRWRRGAVRDTLIRGMTIGIQTAGDG